MKRFGVMLFGLVFLASAVCTPAAQRDQGTANITGRVLSALQLSVRKGWEPFPNEAVAGLKVAADSGGAASVQIVLSGSGPAATSQVVVPLEMRTNEPYELKLTLISSEGSSPATTASIESVRASGSLVAPRALEVSRDQSSIDLMRCLSPVTALRGTRISARGNLTTPHNALVADLHISLSHEGASQGSWRTLLRVSLHRTS